MESLEFPQSPVSQYLDLNNSHHPQHGEYTLLSMCVVQGPLCALKVKKCCQSGSIFSSVGLLPGDVPVFFVGGVNSTRSGTMKCTGCGLYEKSPAEKWKQAA